MCRSHHFIFIQELTANRLRAGFPLSGNSNSVGKCPHVGLQAMKPQLSACAFSLLSKGEHIRCIYPQVESDARHWAIRDTTSSGVRIITDRSHDACSSRALSSIPLVFAASV